jgi:hypothetical protein
MPGVRAIVRPQQRPKERPKEDQIMGNGMDIGTVFQDRRLTPDRHRRATLLFETLGMRGRRKGFRRAEEARNQYLDCPSHHTAALALLILSLSIADAVFPLIHANGGAKELDPIMGMVLVAVGVDAFFRVEAIVIGFCAFFLAIHQNFRLG